MSTPADDMRLTNLLHTYAELVDSGDFSGVGALLARAQVYMTGPGGAAVSGTDVGAIMQRFVRLYDGVPRTRHIVTNSIIEIAADRHVASTRSYYVVLQILQAPVVIVTGRYYDRFARDSDSEEWYFTERIIHVDAVGDVSGHLRSDLAVTQDR